MQFDREFAVTHCGGVERRGFSVLMNAQKQHHDTCCDALKGSLSGPKKYSRHMAISIAMTGADSVAIVRRE
jgi:hypothetical protein